MIRRVDVNWYVHRVARMSPAEIGHRFLEQAHRLLDRRGRFGWRAFGAFAGAVGGLGGFSAATASPELIAIAHEEAEAARAGRFRLLGQVWPVPSQAPWWRYGGWLVDPTSGADWPGRDAFTFDVNYRKIESHGDVKFVWELNRLQFLQGLALDAASTRDEAVWADIWEMLRGWMDANPPYQGINWPSGIEAASRVVSVLFAVTLAGADRAAAAQDALQPFLEAHAWWLDRYPSLYSSANNHRVAELCGLFAATIAAPDMKQAAAWRFQSQRALEHEIAQLFHPDGVGSEQSPTYAAYSLEWFVLAGAWGEVAGYPFSAAFRDRAWAAADHLRWILDEAGQTPRIGDDDEGRVLCLRQAPDDRYVASIVALTQRWLGKPELAATLRPVALRDLICARSDGQPVDIAPRGFRCFPQGGYSVWRRPTLRGTMLLVMDHAPLGFLSIAAHGHADALALWLHWGEEAVLADAGTYLYHSGGAWRDQFRGTPAHNTLCLAGEDQSRIVGAFNWSAHAKTTLVEATESEVSAEHDGYAAGHGLRHRRTVRWTSQSAIEVEDRLMGVVRPSGVDWSLGFTLAPGVTAALQNNTAILTTLAGRRLRVSGTGATLALNRTAYSPCFNEKIETGRLELSGRLEVGTTDEVVARTCIEALD